MVTGVFETAFTGSAGTAEDGRLDGNSLAGFEVCYVGSDGEDGAGEFVAEDDGDFVFGYVVGGYWGEVGAA